MTPASFVEPDSRLPHYHQPACAQQAACGTRLLDRFPRKSGHLRDSIPSSDAGLTGRNEKGVVRASGKGTRQGGRGGRKGGGGGALQAPNMMGIAAALLRIQVSPWRSRAQIRQ